MPATHPQAWAATWVPVLSWLSGDACVLASMPLRRGGGEGGWGLDGLRRRKEAVEGEIA